MATLELHFCCRAAISGEKLNRKERVAKGSSRPAENDKSSPETAHKILTPKE